MGVYVWACMCVLQARTVFQHAVRSQFQPGVHVGCTANHSEWPNRAPKSRASMRRVRPRQPRLGRLLGTHPRPKQRTHAFQRHHLRAFRRCVSALVLALAAPSAADYGILAPQRGQDSLARSARRPTTRCRRGLPCPERSAVATAWAPARGSGGAWCLPAQGRPGRSGAAGHPTPHRCRPLAHAGPGQHDVRPRRGAGPGRARARRQGVPVRRLGRRVEGGRSGAPHAPARPARRSRTSRPGCTR
eukprot:scaffold120714_cov69-Phaeocystis_antarctica.AAC.2